MKITRGSALLATFATLAVIVFTALSAPSSSPSDVAAAASATPALVTQSLSFTASDGTVLHVSVAGSGSLDPRPLIVEDSPYAPAVSTLAWVGSAYNYVELQWRGTGLSGGSLDATGTSGSDQTYRSFWGGPARSRGATERSAYTASRPARSSSTTPCTSRSRA